MCTDMTVMNLVGALVFGLLFGIGFAFAQRIVK